MKKRKATPKLLPLSKTLIYIQHRLPKNRRKFSRSSLYRMAAADKFPKPVKIGASSYWREKELNAWITKLVDGE